MTIAEIKKQYSAGKTHVNVALYGTPIQLRITDIGQSIVFAINESTNRKHWLHAESIESMEN